MGRGARPRTSFARRCSFSVSYAYGAIAQLGERLHGMQEVDGSIPSGSTNKINSLRDNCRPAAEAAGDHGKLNAQPMLRTKLRRVRVTGAHLDYEGSCDIDAGLMTPRVCEHPSTSISTT